jgi:hypothetical protein
MVSSIAGLLPTIHSLCSFIANSDLSSFVSESFLWLLRMLYPAHLVDPLSLFELLESGLPRKRKVQLSQLERFKTICGEF